MKWISPKKRLRPLERMKEENIMDSATRKRERAIELELLQLNIECSAKRYELSILEAKLELKIGDLVATSKEIHAASDRVITTRKG